MDVSKRMVGMAIAAAAAGLFVAGAGVAADSSDSGLVQGKCYGAHACKSQGQCKTAVNACKGHNACKGQGFEMLTEQACIERLGRA